MHPHADYYESNLFPRNWKDMKILNGTLFEIKKWDMALYVVIFFFYHWLEYGLQLYKKYFSNPWKTKMCGL